MANTYELIGKLGGGASEVMEHTAVFSDSGMRFNSLQTDIEVDSDVAVLFTGRSSGANRSYVNINGEEFSIAGSGSIDSHAWKILRGVSAVQIRGRGHASNSDFAAPPRIFTIEII